MVITDNSAEIKKIILIANKGFYGLNGQLSPNICP